MPAESDLPDAAAAADPTPRPHSLGDLFMSFTRLALQGFGGVVAIVQREVVEKKRWLTPEQFVEDWAVAQIMPGPNVVNLSMMIGGRYFGLAGALAALAGMLTVPCLILLVLAAAFSGVADTPVAQGAMRGMGAVAAGLITATGFKLMGALRHNAMGTTVCAVLSVLAFVAIALLRWPLVGVLLGGGIPVCLWAYRQLGRLEAASGVDRT